MATRVYGASDDLIEVDGDEVGGEVDAYGFGTEQESVLVMFSDGTVVSCWYGDPGIWRIRPLRKGSLFDRVDICTDPDAEIHSDIVHLNDGLKWAYSAPSWEEVH